jgi:hypothetical protein
MESVIRSKLHNVLDSTDSNLPAILDLISTLGMLNPPSLTPT